jgi:hypothetical protein
MIAQEGQDQQAHDPVRYARDQRRDEEERYPSMAPEPEDRPKYALETRNGQVIWK